MAQSIDLEERETAIGTLVLRHQPLPKRPEEFVVEIRQNGQLLMSSGTNVSEIALATECLEELDGRTDCDVLVGGLGLGYTAKAALEFPHVASVTVIEFIPAVLEWHRRELFPLGRTLLDDPRCRIVEGDFFSLMGSKGHDNDKGANGDNGKSEGFVPGIYDAILLDIDDAPNKPLHEAHAGFYQPAGLQKLAAHLKPGGVFGLWSCAPPVDGAYEETLAEVFKEVRLHRVPHYHETRDYDDIHFVYVAKSPRQGDRD